MNADGKPLFYVTVNGFSTSWSTINDEITRQTSIQELYFEVEKPRVADPEFTNPEFKHLVTNDNYLEYVETYTTYNESGKATVNLYTDNKLEQTMTSIKKDQVDAEKRRKEEELKNKIWESYSKGDKGKNELLDPNKESFIKIDSLVLGKDYEWSDHSEERKVSRTNGIQPYTDLSNPQILKYQVNVLSTKTDGSRVRRKVILTNKYKYIFTDDRRTLITLFTYG